MFVKRPVYNQQLKCVAFEILSSQNTSPDDESTQNFFDLIHNSETHLPLFIPFAYKNIIEQADPPLENPIILKLSAEDIESIYTLEELNNSLFSIALLINTPQQLAWLNCAEYIALSENLMNSADVRKVVQYSKSKQRKIMAYGLELPMSFEKCKTMIMDYYCGDFLFKPQKNDEQIAANKLNLLLLIQTLLKDYCDFQEISTIIRSDPLLSYQLLRIANSAGFSGGQSIASIDQAIARIGAIHLKDWVMLFSMKNISDKPLEILESGLIRAYMAQSLAKGTHEINPQSAYTAGLLSILDCLLNKPMNELITQIDISTEISSALMNKSGALGELLTLVVAYEAGNWENVSKHEFHGIDLSKLYIDILTEVSQNIKAMH